MTTKRYSVKQIGEHWHVVRYEQGFSEALPLRYPTRARAEEIAEKLQRNVKTRRCAILMR